MNGNIESTSNLNGSGGEHPGSARGQFQHLLERNLGEFLGVRYNPGIGRVNPIDIGVDLAYGRVMGRRQCDRSRVRASAPKRRDLPRVWVDALETGNDHDIARIESLTDPGSLDLGNPGLAMRVVRENPRLRPRKADRRDIEVM